MAVLIHQRPEGEMVVCECDWPDGVKSFNRIVEEYYGDSWQSVWDVADSEQRGLLSATGIAGDCVVLSAHELVIGRDGITVAPEDGVPWQVTPHAREPSE